jgi:hypothetical protein
LKKKEKEKRHAQSPVTFLITCPDQVLWLIFIICVICMVELDNWLYFNVNRGFIKINNKESLFITYIKATNSP